MCRIDDWKLAAPLPPYCLPCQLTAHVSDIKWVTHGMFRNVAEIKDEVISPPFASRTLHRLVIPHLNDCSGLTSILCFSLFHSMLSVCLSFCLPLPFCLSLHPVCPSDV